MVGLVEHQAPVGRQHRRLLPVVLRPADREVGRQQVVVHHHDVRLGRPPAGPEQEAAVEVRTLEPGAEVRLRAHLVPDLGRRRHRQVAQRAVRVWPAHSDRPISSSSLSCSSSVRWAPTAWCSRDEAEVVPPALEQREARRVVLGRERLAQQRQVLADQLLLEVDRVGADDRPLLVGPRPGQRRHQVGERLPDPGARLHQLHAAVVVPVGDVGRHVPLAAAVLVLAEVRRRSGPRSPSVSITSNGSIRLICRSRGTSTTT